MKKGENFFIFPEGGRSPDGKLREAKLGAAKIAILSKKKVVPVGIIGSYKILPKGARFPRAKKADMIIGKPLDFSKYKGKDYKTLKTVTTIMMKEIAKLTGQEYNY